MTGRVIRILMIRHGARGRPAPDLPHAGARDDPLFTDPPDTILAFHWHADTFTPPGDPILLAGGPGGVVVQLDAIRSVARSLVGAWVDVCAGVPARPGQAVSGRP